MNTKQKRLYELSLIIPAFSYLYEQRKNLLINDVKKDIESKLIVSLLKINTKLRTVIKSYKALQQDVLNISNIALSEMNSKNTNVLLFGINLLLEHSNIKGKKVILGLKADLLDLEDTIIEVLECNFDYIDKTKIVTEQYIEVIKKEILKSY